ncbi:NusG domain II-containing protein [Amedibacillus dolichus]|uniref:NusG domain II-containing protein n=1 Tax=Amedibacillus dolichus TaxID=31971 RepID=A0ABT7UE50_9FIRM|nr:NusG domain II-containing protein [Amedibacillus dolichus]MDM8157901.1 NusG domain II-containing protein [Amedibacillus dolichus]
MKRADKLCILVIMAACVLFYVPLWFAYEGTEANEVVVQVRNEEVLRVPLWEDGTYPVEGKLGEVLVEVNEGRVRVEKETSPYHYCSIQGYVSDPSTPIICLPNEVVVTIEGSEEGTVDTQIQ